MIMITTKNNFSGANFEYTSESGCTANGEYRCENGNIVSVNVNGTIDGKNFWASRDAAGNVNISGVPVSIIAKVAAEVENIMVEIEEIVHPSTEV